MQVEQLLRHTSHCLGLDWLLVKKKKNLLDVYLKYCVPRQSAESCKLQNHGPSASSASVRLSACTRKGVGDSITQVYLKMQQKRLKEISGQAIRQYGIILM